MVKVETKEVNELLKRLSLLKQTQYPKIIKQSARRVAVNMAYVTRPYGTSAQSHEKGKRSAMSDVRKVIKTPASVSEKLTDEQKSQFGFLMENKPNVVNKFLKSIGINLRYQRGGLKGKHQAARRNGKVPKNHTAQIFSDSDKIDSYITRVEKAVGYAKHGWAMCARKLGGTRGINAKWITSKKGGRPDPSQVTESIRPNGVGYTITNNINYVSYVTPNNAIRAALRHEERTLVKQINIIIQKQKRR